MPTGQLHFFWLILTLSLFPSTLQLLAGLDEVKALGRFWIYSRSRQGLAKTPVEAQASPRET